MLSCVTFNQLMWQIRGDVQHDNFEGCRSSALYILDTLEPIIQCYTVVHLFYNVMYNVISSCYTQYIMMEYKYFISLMMMLDSITSQPPELSLVKLSERNGPPGAARWALRLRRLSTSWTSCWAEEPRPRGPGRRDCATSLRSVPLKRDTMGFRGFGGKLHGMYIYILVYTCISICD